MRNLIPVLLLAVSVAGCQSITDTLPYADPKAEVQTTSCDGVNLTWDYCYEVAARRCPGGYQLSDRRESSDSPAIAYRTEVKRTLYFRCK